MKMNYLLAGLVITFLASSGRAQQQQIPITSLLAHAWLVDFDQSNEGITGPDLQLLHAAQAARQGRFHDAERLMEQAGQADSSPRIQLLRLLFNRITLDRQFSLLGGGVGAQRRLQLLRIESGPDEEALQLQTTSAIEHYPQTDRDEARLADKYKLILDDCQSFALSLIRGGTDGIPVSSGFSDNCKIFEQPMNSKALGLTEKTIMEKVTLAGLASATGDIASARRYLTEGRSAAIEAHLARSEAEFDMRLGDLMAMPHGDWETLGYDLGSDGYARLILEAGAQPKSRTYPSGQMLSEAEQWYSNANDLAGAIRSAELSAEIRFRQACLAYVEGDIRGAIPLFSEANSIAGQSGSARLGAMSLGISALFSGNRTLYAKAMLSLWQEGDIGGAASLVEIAASYASTLKFRKDTHSALEVTLTALNSVHQEKIPVAVDMLMTDLVSLYRLNGESDLQLYWARAAVADEEELIARSSTHFIDPFFLETENTHLATLLWNVAVELYARTLTEQDDDKYWANQLQDVENRIFARDALPQARLTSDNYRRMKADVGDRIILARRVSHVASCESNEYEGLRAELVQRNEPSLLEDLDKFLGQCGDADANRAALERLHGTDVAVLLTTLRNSSRRTTLTEQRDFAKANIELSLTMDTAMELQDFRFIQRWLDEIEISQGVTPKSYLTRLGMLLGTGQPEEARDRVMRLLSDKDGWDHIDDRTRIGALSALVEAYAQLGDANAALSGLLGLWREQAGTNRTYSSAPTATALRRATLLRTRPELLTSQEKDELLQLCLIDEFHAAAQSSVETSQLLSNIPTGVTVFVYFVGSRTWLWRLERGRTPKLVPLSSPREYVSTVRKLNSKFTSHDSIPGWEPYSKLLYSLLIQPAGELGAGSILAIAGAGYFQGLPFDALGPSPQKLLGMQHPVVYVEDLLTTASLAKPIPRRSVVIGEGGLSSDQAVPEAKSIAALLGVKALVGQEAQKPRIAQELVGATLVHFSTHGVIDSLNPYRSYLLLSENDRIEGFELPSLLKSANQITFSACDSNAASAPVGEDAHPGFSRGLTLFAHWAGARWVVSSLWEADDAAARTLMVSYYKSLLIGDSNPVALFNAKSYYLSHEKRQERLAPWFWAGFTLSSMGLSDLNTSPGK
jgi:CHAT domain-containing protein